MRRIVMAMAWCLTGLLALPAAASGPAVHFEEDVAGDEIACEEHTYTVVSGTIRGTVHEGGSASGNQNFTVTLTPDRVALEDEDGAPYAMRGAVWFGGASNDQTGALVITATHFLQIVARGEGVVDSVRMVERLRDWELETMDFGSCEF